MARDDLHFRLRIPDDLKAKIEATAAQNKRSMTAEIIARLEEYEALAPGNESLTSLVQRQQKELEHLRRTGVKLPSGLFYRVDDAAIRRQRSFHEEVIQALEAAYPAPAINEMDEVGWEWWTKIANATLDARDETVKEANADLRSRGWPHEFWLEPDDKHGTPTVVLGIRRFGPRKAEK